ncbi:hypothetical protein FisN_11Hh179 [Fistulifera solaris]|uniref:SGNH hydrolase-type esterase domain-containing protein n=1 Tax=Fistulifera solaris TaxID=1519565 RepID=A0A1Z5JK62_FISSO|nr:hypothetical protein FisN_11Hh179 [Fistulifera solaris]|eukprot:GAX14364.1 hypothetical protein FisN_11Hh179 [Fistulifera solaris]
MFDENRYLRDVLRPRQRRTLMLLLVASLLALIPFEWVQNLLQTESRSMLSKTLFNETDQTDASLHSTANAMHDPPSPRTMTGTWIGNTWVPPTGWKYHTPNELRQFYSGKRILWVGDSTGRRTAMNLYALLDWKNSSFLADELSSPNLIDAAKKGPHECNKWIEANFRPNNCRTVNFTSEEEGEHIYVKAVCHTDVERFLQTELEGRANITADIDVIIVAIGIWDVIRPQACRKGLQNRTLVEMVSDLVELTNELQITTGKVVIWRTSGYSEQQEHIINKTSTLNNVTMNKLDQVRVNNTLNGLPNRFNYVNWGGAVLARSRPGERIRGDMKPHYGLEPRHVLIEMITNLLEKEEYLRNMSGLS